jgi:acyl-CoA synthetase (NDP forming)
VGLGEFGAVASDEFTNRVADGIMAAAESAPVPVVAASYSSRQFNNRRIDQFSRKGMPVLDGISNMLRAFAHGFRYRDRPRITAVNDSPLLHNTGEIGAALGRLRENDEHGALELLALAGITTLPALQIQTAADIEAAVSRLEKDSLWPVALKTASGHAHKSDLDGVVLGIAGADQLRQSYKALSHSLGPNALVQPMAPQGPEVALGIIVDADFGPILMIASGGNLVELSGDRMFVLCPVTDDEIDILIENLACAPLFKCYRNQPALDRAALASTIRTLSTLACSVQDQILSIDINPVVVHRDGAVAIDALVQKKE